ncbi:MAG: hypothetical protein WCJ64_05770 [Rhodospirillaceae bacterium]
MSKISALAQYVDKLKAEEAAVEAIGGDSEYLTTERFNAESKILAMNPKSLAECALILEAAIEAGGAEDAICNVIYYLRSVTALQQS